MKDPNPKQAFGDKKPPLQLNPPAALVEMSTALREGAFKYGAWNFRETDVEIMTYIGAIQRHLACLLEGEWFDTDNVVHPETGETLDAPHKSHLAGILASAAIIVDCENSGRLIDNRPMQGQNEFSEFMSSREMNT